MKETVIIMALIACLLTACGKNTTDFVGDILSNDNSSGETEIREETDQSGGIAIKDENGTVVDDFNEDGLTEDKVRIDDFTYLAENGLDYFDFVQIQARLSRYLDYYIPTKEDKIWNVSIVENGFIQVPELYKFYLYIEELDATVECKLLKDPDEKKPCRFSCEKIDGVNFKEH